MDEIRPWPHAHLATLLDTSAFSVAEFRCPGSPSVTEVERAPYPEIVIPRVGSYLRTSESREVLLSRATLAFFEAGAPYSIRHFRRSPDLSTVISITDHRSLRDALGLRLPRGRTFARSAIRMPSQVMLLHRQMLRDLKTASTRLGAEEAAATIIMKSLAHNVEGERELARPVTRSQRSERNAHAAAIMHYLAGAFRDRVSLDCVAKAVGLSPFHICRIFVAATGTTIHQHLISLRMEAATAELLETQRSITEIAHAVGFSSHSHLTARFTKTLGMPPSVLRARLPRRGH